MKSRVNVRNKPAERLMNERDVFILLRRLAAKLARDNGGTLVIQEADLEGMPEGQLKIMIKNGDLVVEFTEVPKDKN